MNDTAPTQGPRIYRLRALIAVAAASAIIGFATARHFIHPAARVSRLVRSIIFDWWV